MTLFLKNRFLPLLLCAAMVFGMLPVSAFAAEPPAEAALTEPTEAVAAETEAPTEPTEPIEESTEAAQVPSVYSQGTDTGTDNPTHSVQCENWDTIYATGTNLNGIDAVWYDADTSYLVTDDTVSSYTVTLEGYTGGEVPIQLQTYFSLDENGQELVYEPEWIGAYMLVEEEGETYFAPIPGYSVSRGPTGPCISFTATSESFTFVTGIMQPPFGIPWGAELTGIDVTGPEKTRYFLRDVRTDGDSSWLDLEGLHAEAVYTYDSQEYRRPLYWDRSGEGLEGYTLADVDLTTPGQKQYVLSYQGCRAYFKIWLCRDTFVSKTGGAVIRFDTENVLSAKISTAEPNEFQEKALEGYFTGEPVYYSISANYADGADALTGKATVTLPIPEGITNPVVLYISYDGKTIENMLAHDNGDGTLTFVTDHFSTYVVGDGTYEGIHLEKQNDKITSSTQKITAWVLTNTLEAGKQYLIVSANAKGQGNALTNNNNSVANTTVEILSDDEKLYIIPADASKIAWTVGGSNNNWTFLNNTRYLRLHNETWNGEGLNLSTSSQGLRYENEKSTLRYPFYYGYWNYYLQYSNGWSVSNSANSIYLYVKTDNYEIGTPGGEFYVEAADHTTAPAIENHEVTLESKLFWKETDGSPEENPAGWSAVTYNVVETKGNKAVVSGIQDGKAILSGTEGIAVIQASYTKDGITVYDEFVIHAKEPSYSVIIPDPASYQLKQDGTLELEGQVRINGEPEDTLSSQIVWTSSDETVATVDENGVVTAHALGDVTITATYTVGGKSYSDAVALEVVESVWTLDLHHAEITKVDGVVTDVVVKDLITTTIPIKDVVPNQTHDNLWSVIRQDGVDKGMLSPEELPKLRFVSSNANIATVNSATGEVTFTGQSGTVVITAIYTYAEGKAATDQVTFSVSDEHFIIPEDGTDDFPHFPEEGSIRLDKAATAVGNFSETGITQVEISMTGVPYTTNNEIDVVIMIDASSSMNNSGINREDPAKEAAVQALNTLIQKTDSDGEFNKNRVAVYTFDGWNSSENAYNSYAESVFDNYPANDPGSGNGNYNINQLAPLQTYDAERLDLATQKIESFDLDSGTNYAAALRQCHLTLEAARKEEGYNRKQYVIFLTDGAASTGFAYKDDSSNKGYSMYYYTPLGSDGFDSIDKVAEQTEWYSYQMKQAGVEIYTVGLQIKGSNDAETESANTVLKKIAGTKNGDATQTEFEGYAMTIGSDDDASQVVTAFQSIAQMIMEAAKDVKVEDKITEEYTMIFDFPNAAVAGRIPDQEFYIEVLDYPLIPKYEIEGDPTSKIENYLRSDDPTSLARVYLGLEDGRYYAASDANGTASPAPVFSQTAFGSMYYWTTNRELIQDYSGVSVTLGSGTGAVTYYFAQEGIGVDDPSYEAWADQWYNLTSGAYAYGTPATDDILNEKGEITGTTTTCENLILATPYFVYNASTKMLVWTVDKLTRSELALSYFLYLEKSGGYEDDPGRTPAGTYETNEYADFIYDNHHANECLQELPQPQMTWYGAQISYVFYLVNEDGDPVNQAGRVVPFSEAYYVTDVFTYTVTWNDLEKVSALEATRLAQDLIPDVYELFDPGAAYRIHVYESKDESGVDDHFRIDSGLESSDIFGNNAKYTTYVFNTKAGDKYSAPGVYAAQNPFLCKGDGSVDRNSNGQLVYTPHPEEVEKNYQQYEFTEIPAGSVESVKLANNKFHAYYENEDGSFYTIVQKNNATIIDGFDFSNTTVAFAVQWTPKLQPDTVVIDYGLDVLINVSTNDSLNTRVNAVRNTAPNGIAMNTGVYHNPGSEIMVELTNDQGDVVANAYRQNLNEVGVILDKSNGMKLTEPLTFFYEAEVSYYDTQSELEAGYMYSSVTVVPATTVYYEDEYVTLGSESQSVGEGTISVSETAASAYTKLYYIPAQGEQQQLFPEKPENAIFALSPKENQYYTYFLEDGKLVTEVTDGEPAGTIGRDAKFTSCIANIQYTPKGDEVQTVYTGRPNDADLAVQIGNTNQYYAYYLGNDGKLTTRVTTKGSDWVKDSENPNGGSIVQASDRPGPNKISEAFDADNNYGYDKAYGSFQKQSLGSSAMVTVTPSNQASATFSFYGTGFDVISVTSNMTGTYICTVKDSNNTVVRTILVDTFYGYKLVGEDWVVSTNDPNALWQVPVITVEGLPYGLYTAELIAAYGDFFDHTGAGKYDLYLDAVRIYDPLGITADRTGMTDAQLAEKEFIESVYSADGENWPQYEELRNKLISAANYRFSVDAEGTITATGEALPGIVYIDSTGDTNVVADYVSYGPNNEVYLTAEKSITFSLPPLGTGIEDIQIGLSLAGGTDTDVVISNADGTKTLRQTIATATDLYYSIKDLAGETLTIANSGTGILSVTTLKTTYAAAPQAVDSALALLQPEDVAQVLMRMYRADAPSVPDVPEITEPAQTDPTDPSETEPGVTDPTDPSETEPGTTDPTDPSETEPGVTDPTDPSETEPGTTDPTEPSETEPAEPGETEPEEEPFDPGSVELPFADVSENDWFRNSVAYVYATGLMNGVSGHSFAPQATATRAMIVTVLYRIEGQPEVSGKTKFRDVPEDTWYSDAVCWASGAGIVNGLSETEFGPDRNVTREQLATMLCRYLTAKGMDTAAAASLSGFPDAPDVSSWAVDAMRWAIANGIITGSSDGNTVTLQPGANALRSQIAAILQRFCEKYERERIRQR